MEVLLHFITLDFAFYSELPHHGQLFSQCLPCICEHAPAFATVNPLSSAQVPLTYFLLRALVSPLLR